MQKEMGLSYKEAEERAENNDLVNAQYIRTKTDLKKHEVLKIEEQGFKKVPKPNMIEEFVRILEFANLRENNHISGSKDDGILEFV